MESYSETVEARRILAQIALRKQVILLRWLCMISFSIWGIILSLLLSHC